MPPDFIKYGTKLKLPAADKHPARGVQTPTSGPMKFLDPGGHDH